MGEKTVREMSEERELSLQPLVLSSFVLISLFFFSLNAESANFLTTSIRENPSFPRKFIQDNVISVFQAVPFNSTGFNGTLLSNGSFALQNGTVVPPNPSYGSDLLTGLLGPNISSLVQLSCLFLLWYQFNIYFNIYNKQVLKVYPFPTIVTAMQFGVGSIIVLLMWGLGFYPVPTISTSNLYTIVPVAMAHALGNLFTNMSVKAVAVSFTHVIKSMEPFFSVALSALVFNKVPSLPIIASLVPIVGGVALASITEVSFNWSGFISAMLSNLTFQSRNVLSKHLLVEQVAIDNINLFSIVTLMSFLILVPMAAFREPAGFTADALKPEIHKIDIQKTAMRAFLSSLCFHAYQQVSYMILQRVTPVTHAVGNCMKRVLVIVASVVFFRTPVSSTNAAGIALALLGVFVYSQVKLMKFKSV